MGTITCSLFCGLVFNLNATHDIRISLLSGEELPLLLKRTEYYLQFTKKYDNHQATKFITLFRDTILTLMGREFTSDIQEDDLNSMPIGVTDYHKAVRCYWVGQTERCHYFTGKIINPDCRHHNAIAYSHRRFLMLYYGINSLKIIANSKRTSQSIKETPKSALGALKESFKTSHWTFRNKVHLLEAEIFSFEENNDEAKASYAAAIESAQRSNFIHEEGLAWELFGTHYAKIGDTENAQNSFNHAKQCYSQWGSQRKVEGITREMTRLQVKLIPS